MEAMGKALNQWAEKKFMISAKAPLPNCQNFVEESMTIK